MHGDVYISLSVYTFAFSFLDEYYQKQSGQYRHLLHPVELVLKVCCCMHFEISLRGRHERICLCWMQWEKTRVHTSLWDISFYKWLSNKILSRLHMKCKIWDPIYILIQQKLWYKHVCSLGSCLVTTANQQLSLCLRLEITPVTKRAQILLLKQQFTDLACNHLTQL